MFVSALPAVAVLVEAAASLALPVAAAPCLGCHEKTTPGIVGDWRHSRHAAASVGCDACHGAEHVTALDSARARLPTPGTCAPCHRRQVDQFQGGKHALAWAAMAAMPTFHYQPATLTDGLKGCGGCHAIGLKAEADVADIRRASGQSRGVASCDACHTRHTFSVKEAREPEACKTCHMGFDHPQWEMYESSKHGVRYALRRMGAIPNESAAPTCQDCHFPGGDHGVATAWGFLGVRLPLPGDAQWREDQVTILKALGVLDPEGRPTSLLELVKGARMARLTPEEWQAQRARMVETCKRCHAEDFAVSQLESGDRSLREADRLMAEAIEVVAELYRDGLLKRSQAQPFDYPDVLLLHDSATVVEQRLFVMLLEHRMRAFQGSFHDSPDHALWDGFSEMKRDLCEIRELAAAMRRARRDEGKVRSKGPPSKGGAAPKT